MAAEIGGLWAEGMQAVHSQASGLSMKILRKGQICPNLIVPDLALLTSCKT